MLLVLAGCTDGPQRELSFRLGTTSSVEDSGLLDTLRAAFAQAYPAIRMSVITGGTGEVLELARRRDVDVVITHDPAAESVFVAQGHGRWRRELMYNDFVIAGAATDAARIRGTRDAAQALQSIARARAPFVSRADDSGTHKKERSLWGDAGLRELAGLEWYIEAGAGMGDALRLASNRGAYILTDRGTFLRLRDQLRLIILVEGDPRLLNRYSIIPVTGTGAREAAADSFAAWVSGPAARSVIAAFGVREFGRPLFHPAK